MTLAVITILSCVGVLAGDIFATILTIAETRGRPIIAGLCDVGNDAFSKFILVAYGGTALTHHGLLGWLCVLPVLATGFVATSATTWRTRRMRKADPTAELLAALRAATPEQRRQINRALLTS